MIKAVIFDMDGVMIDSEPVYMQWDKKFLEHYGKSVSEEELIRNIGHTGRECEEHLMEILDMGISYDEFRGIYDGYFETYSDELDIDYNDILDKDLKAVLNELKARKIEAAIASSSTMEEIGKVISDCGLKDYFSVIVSGEQFEKSKPEPQIYLTALEKLGVKADECIAVEDSALGILAAKRAGLIVAAKQELRFGMDQSQADYIIEKLSEVFPILER